jgi:hypothetical protein
MKIRKKIKKRYRQGKKKLWDIASEEMNYPMKSIIIDSLTIIAILVLSGIFITSEHLLSKIVGIGLVCLGGYFIYFTYYLPLKRYETRYGKTGLGDEFLKELNSKKAKKYAKQ